MDEDNAARRRGFEAFDPSTMQYPLAARRFRYGLMTICKVYGEPMKAARRRLHEATGVPYSTLDSVRTGRRSPIRIAPVISDGFEKLIGERILFPRDPHGDTYVDKPDPDLDSPEAKAEPQPNPQAEPVTVQVTLPRGATEIILKLAFENA